MYLPICTASIASEHSTSLHCRQRSAHICPTTAAQQSKHLHCGTLVDCGQRHSVLRIYGDCVMDWAFKHMHHLYTASASVWRQSVTITCRLSTDNYMLTWRPRYRATNPPRHGGYQPLKAPCIIWFSAYCAIQIALSTIQGTLRYMVPCHCMAAIYLQLHGSQCSDSNIYMAASHPHTRARQVRRKPNAIQGSDSLTSMHRTLNSMQFGRLQPDMNVPGKRNDDWLFSWQHTIHAVLARQLHSGSTQFSGLGLGYTPVSPLPRAETG